MNEDTLFERLYALALAAPDDVRTMIIMKNLTRQSTPKQFHEALTDIIDEVTVSHNEYVALQEIRTDAARQMG